MILSQGLFKILVVMEIDEIRSRIDEMAKEMAIMEEKLTEAIVNAVYEASKENPKKPKRISKNIIIIRFSELIGNPWNYEFYDWEKSVKVVLEYLKNKPAKQWKEMLLEKLKSSKNNIVYFDKTIYNGWFKKNYSIPVNALFIEKIIQKI